MTRTWTRTSLLLLMGVASSLCFNLDTDKPTIFPMHSAGFGHTVVQYANWVVVGAPQEVKAVNQTGSLYRCDYSTARCDPIQLQVPPEAVNMSLGLSLRAATTPSRLLACGPTVHHACNKNMYLNGFCFLWASPSWQAQRLPADLQECPRQEQDIVFLIDGSGSISSRDFDKMLSFVKDVMSQFQRPRTQFSLMQFSSTFWIHFTFKDFRQSSDPKRLLDSVYQLTGNTHTASAILKVINQLFSVHNGARADASKILIVITDGKKKGDRLDYGEVIPEAEAKGIIRYAVGVGSAFQDKRSLRELNAIASTPSKEHIFQVDNFDALRDIQEQLREKIFAIEGTHPVSSSSFELEMSQEGFSAVLTPDGPVLGAVGSFSWSGGAFLYPQNMKPTFINMSQENVDMADSYLGYSTELALWKGVQSLVLGAPRHQHTGKAVLFTQEAGQWRPKAEVPGTQIGSYFGASLCSVDVDRDGSSDLVLIGAPHYYEPTRGGRVSVCPLPRGRVRWQCQAVLRGEQGHPWGRFGAALTVLGDVNGDKLTDVAIGAPGEQENRGAVYLFHGASVLGISPAHSQRIAGSQLSPTLRYFGQSLSGGRDLTMDGLMDLAVGAQGQALLLRSQPVLRVEVTMTFTPRELARSVFECRENVVRGLTAGEVRVCLRVQKSTGDRLPPGEIRSTVLYDLALDSTRPQPRAVFEETKNSTRRQTRVLGLSQMCETLKLQLPECVEDSVTPVVLRLNFSLEGQPLSSYGNLRPVLAMDAQTLFTASFPFEKNCGNDSVCQDALSISLSFTNLHTLVVGGPRNFNLTVTVRNQGEDSYGTRVAFFYPPGLSYRRVSGVQSRHSGRTWRINCESDPSAQARAWHSGSCTINQPIFPGNSEITFNITLDVDSDASLGDRLLLKANVTSENNSPRTNQSESQLALPVKYAVYMVVASREGSIKFLSFPASKKTSHIISHQYQFNNLGQRSPRISVVLWIPIRLNQEPVWGDADAVFSPDLNRTCRREEREPPLSSFRAELSKAPVLNCSIAVCLRVQCALAEPFGGQEEFSVNLTGSLSFGWYIETPHKHLQVVSTAEILQDDPGFAQLPGQEALVRAQTETKVEPYEMHDPVPLIVGSSVGGLVLLALITAAMYKLGFFKRQYKDMMSEAASEAASPQ